MNVLQWAKALFKGLFQTEKESFVDYVCGDGEALPLPLSPEEECAKLRLMLGKAGREGEEAKAELIKHNLRLVVYISKKFDNTGVDNDDLISIGTIGLIKAINSFKPDKKIKLATYASRCIENEILMFIRKSQTHKREVSIDEPLSVDWDGNELLLSDILGSDSDIVTKEMEEDEERKILRAAVSDLSDRERIIIELRFGLGSGEELTQKEVADALGISQSYISRLEKKIMSNLRKKIEEKI